MAHEIQVPDQKNPATGVQPVTPSDTVDIPLCRALSIATGGDIQIISVQDRIAGSTSTVTLPAGLWPVQAHRVYATGTTATGISAWY